MRLSPANPPSFSEKAGWRSSRNTTLVPTPSRVSRRRSKRAAALIANPPRPSGRSLQRSAAANDGRNWGAFLETRKGLLTVQLRFGASAGFLLSPRPIGRLCFNDGARRTQSWRRNRQLNPPGGRGCPHDGHATALPRVPLAGLKRLVAR